MCRGKLPRHTFVMASLIVDATARLLYYLEKKECNVDNINLDMLPKDGERMLKEIAAGNMVVARSKNDFLYIVAFDDKFHMFSHTPGAPGGGQKQLPIDEKHTAIIRKIADMSDTVYLAEFDKNLNLYGVMQAAEEGILAMFPGEDRDSDAMIDFGITDDTDSV